MKVRLLAPHIVPIDPGNDRWCPVGTILDPVPPDYQLTPLMEPLDDEAKAMVDYMKLKVWGRYPWPPGLFPPGYMGMPPLDNPPIPRPLEENQPVFYFSGRPEYL